MKETEGLVKSTYNDEQATNTYEHGADNWYNPMNLRLSAPSISKESDGHNGREVHHQG